MACEPGGTVRLEKQELFSRIQTRWRFAYLFVSIFEHTAAFVRGDKRCG
jgi:hypothetical protein